MLYNLNHKFLFLLFLVSGCTSEFSSLTENSSNLSHFNYKEGTSSSYVHHWLLVERVSNDPNLSSKYMTANDFIGGSIHSSPFKQSELARIQDAVLYDILVNFHIHQDRSIHLVIKESVDDIRALTTDNQPTVIDGRFYYVADCPDIEYEVMLYTRENNPVFGGEQQTLQEIEITDNLSTCDNGVITFSEEVADHLHLAFANLHDIDMVLSAVQAKTFYGLSHYYGIRSVNIVGYNETFSKLQGK